VNYTSRRRRNAILVHAAALFIGVCTILPVLYMVYASITPQRDLIAVPMRWVPHTLDFSRYRTILSGGSDSVGQTFRAAFMNSLIVALVTVSLSMIVGVLGAYAFARLRFRFRRAVLFLFLGTYMLPQIALLIPLYLIMSALGLLDSKVGLIIVDMSLVVPFVLWMLSNYFATIPEELEEAARVDGTTRIGALFRVILPAAMPGLFSTAMFALLLAWDEFMYALIFTSSDRSKTLPVAISEFAGKYTTDFGLVAAGGLIAAIPPVLVAVAFQRYVVSGLSAGSVK